MPDTGSPYFLRYPSLTDPPDGPDLGKDLADDVHEELARIDAATAVDVGNLKRVYTTGTIATTTQSTDLVLGSVTIPDPGFSYRIKTEIAGLLLMSTATGVRVQLRNTVGGATVGRIANFGNGFAGTSDIFSSSVGLASGPFSGATTLELFADHYAGTSWSSYDLTYTGAVVTVIPV